MSIIVSHIPGRLRLRLPELKSMARNRELATALAVWDGVQSAEGKPTCGSILLHYDPERVSPLDLAAKVIALFPDPTKSREDNAGDKETAKGSDLLWSMNRPAKIGMLGALGGSLVALSVGKSMHAVLGAMHVAFLLIHLANHRKKILQ